MGFELLQALISSEEFELKRLWKQMSLNRVEYLARMNVIKLSKRKWIQILSGFARDVGLGFGLKKTWMDWSLGTRSSAPTSE